MKRFAQFARGFGALWLILGLFFKVTTRNRDDLSPLLDSWPIYILCAISVLFAHLYLKQIKDD